MLKKGSSETWPNAMEAITGSRTMNATALISYFQPLITYLEAEMNEMVTSSVGRNLTHPQVSIGVVYNNKVQHRH